MLNLQSSVAPMPLTFARILIPDVISVKDPCPVFDGKIWHLFTTYGTHEGEVWDCVHFMAEAIDGPYHLRQFLRIDLPGGGIAAPGVMFDESGFHLFLQTEYLRAGGLIGYMRSRDGFQWSKPKVVMRSRPGTDHAGIYDPHPAVIGGQKVLAYSALPLTPNAPPQPDIHYAVADRWTGPWTPKGPLLRHEDVLYHNQRNHQDYEWGLEGPQLAELPDGRVLLTFVAFLAEGARGTRQRLAFAVSDGLGRPFIPIAPMIAPPSGGENGHGVTMMHNGKLVTFLQQRFPGGRWRPALALDPLLSATFLGQAEPLQEKAA